MAIDSRVTTSEIPIRAERSSVHRLGHWTTARSFEVDATAGSVVLDLRSSRIEPGLIEVRLDARHSMIKLLVPDGAVVDDGDLRRVGRCGFVDWSGGPTPGGRLIRVAGELNSSELRVNRGGIAIVAAMLTGEYLADLRRAFQENRIGSLKDLQDAYREGRWTTVDDPGRLS